VDKLAAAWLAKPRSLWSPQWLHVRQPVDVSYNRLHLRVLIHRMATEEPVQSSLLDLPDPCLLKVLQCCAADDQCSVLSAARSHSRLHQFAVASLHSITADVRQQQRKDDVLLYLTKHSCHVDSLRIRDMFGRTLSLHLPPNLQLSSLQLGDCQLELQPGYGPQGVLGFTALKKLELKCRLSDVEPAEALAAALSQLPDLDHLSIRFGVIGMQQVPLGMLLPLQQLTYLELVDISDLADEPTGHALQPLQALTRLSDLRLSWSWLAAVVPVTASVLSGTQHLTRLHCTGRSTCEHGALAGKTKLQHLMLAFSDIPGGAAGDAQLLSHLQPLQQLTHLDLTAALVHGWDSEVDENTPPAAAYEALTASSKLQHLSIAACRLPVGVLQHIFSAGRQLPHLTSLDISDVQQVPGRSAAPAPEGSGLVSCCPGLRQLDMLNLQCRAQLLAPLQALSRLHTLRLSSDKDTAEEVVQALCQLTMLRQLTMDVPRSVGMMPRLTKLKHLTQLEYGKRAFLEGFITQVTEPLNRCLLLCAVSGVAS
jgi:hypothetical protein